MILLTFSLFLLFTDLGKYLLFKGLKLFFSLLVANIYFIIVFAVLYLRYS
jgi:hypothetical protein